MKNKIPAVGDFHKAMVVFDRLDQTEKLKYMTKVGYGYQLSDLNNAIELDMKFFHWLVDSGLSYDFEDDFLTP